MHISFGSIVLPLLLGTAFTPSKVLADCECGYSINATNSPQYTVFTDLLESDFLHLKDISKNTDWITNVYTTNPTPSDPYGQNASAANLVDNYIKADYTYAGQGVLGGDPGLQLYVRGGVPTDGHIPTSETVSSRTDMLYGSFRAAMKLTPQQGTCSSFFWYFSDQQELDVEFLSHDYLPAPTTAAPVYFVNHHVPDPATGAASTFDVIQLPFRPDQGYHEYRFDWTPNKISFYADGQWLLDWTTFSPFTPGPLHLKHWSTGADAWSRGPPPQDAIQTVSYVKAYFNSSSPDRQNAYKSRCADPSAANAICEVPDQTVAPDPAGPHGETFFFSCQHNMTEGQVVYGKIENKGLYGA